MPTRMIQVESRNGMLTKERIKELVFGCVIIVEALG